MSVTCNLIVIYDTYVKMIDDNRCPFHLFEILIFWVVRGECKKWPKMSKHSVWLIPYLRNHTSFDYDFWYTCVKWWYLQELFFFFFSQNFDFSAFEGGKRAKNGPKLPVSVCNALYLRNCRSYHQDFWYTGVKQWYLQVFFFSLFNTTLKILKFLCFLLAHSKCFFNK